MSRRRHLPPPALLEIDEQTFWEKYRPIVEPAEGQVIRGPEHVANLMAENASMADAILALAEANARQQADLGLLLKQLNADPELVKALLQLPQLSSASKEGAA
ncbi:MAG: hypothetical protein AB7D31_08285 [Stenotrophomonas sp.]